MELAEFNLLESQVLWASFVICLVFGAIAQRTHFCTMGAVSDIYNIGSWTRMRVWGMAAGVAMISFYIMSFLGWIKPTAALYAVGKMVWLSALIGGLFFGFGMVLASGCASKTLIRVGEGNLKSFVVFFMLGLGAYSGMWGISSALRMYTVKFGSAELANGNLIPGWISSATGMDLSSVGLVMSLLVGGGLVFWALWNKKFRSSSDNLLAGFGVGLCVAAMWWVIGDLGYVEMSPDTLLPVYAGTSSGNMQALSFTSPMARTISLLIATDLDNFHLNLGVVTVLGVILGSLGHALYSKTFQWEGFNGSQDTALHMIGGICMGVGGVTAGGCTVGQGLSGISTLSIVSVLAVAGIMFGAVIGLRLQMWLLMRSMQE